MRYCHLIHWYISWSASHATYVSGGEKDGIDWEVFGLLVQTAFTELSKVFIEFRNLALHSRFFQTIVARAHGFILGCDVVVQRLYRSTAVNKWAFWGVWNHTTSLTAFVLDHYSPHISYESLNCKDDTKRLKMRIIAAQCQMVMPLDLFIATTAILARPSQFQASDMDVIIPTVENIDDAAWANYSFHESQQ